MGNKLLYQNGQGNLSECCDNEDVFPFEATHHDRTE